MIKYISLMNVCDCENNSPLFNNKQDVSQMRISYVNNF